MSACAQIHQHSPKPTHGSKGFIVWKVKCSCDGDLISYSPSKGTSFCFEIIPTLLDKRRLCSQTRIPLNKKCCSRTMTMMKVVIIFTFQSSKDTRTHSFHIRKLCVTWHKRNVPKVQQQQEIKASFTTSPKTKIYRKQAGWQLERQQFL